MDCHHNRSLVQARRIARCEGKIFGYSGLLLDYAGLACIIGKPPFQVPLGSTMADAVEVMNVAASDIDTAHAGVAPRRKVSEEHGSIEIPEIAGLGAGNGKGSRWLARTPTHLRAFLMDSHWPCLGPAASGSTAR